MLDTKLIYFNASYAAINFSIQARAGMPIEPIMLMQVTALQIASLKKVNKKSQILLLDKNGSTSKVIARELARKGFRKIRVVQV